MANKNYPRYNHQYIHCSGNECVNRYDCVHYLSLQEALELGLENYKLQSHCENKDIGYVKVKIEKLSKERNKK